MENTTLKVSLRRQNLELYWFDIYECWSSFNSWNAITLIYYQHYFSSQVSRTLPEGIGKELAFRALYKNVSNRNNINVS